MSSTATPDQTRPDQTRPARIRLDQTRPDQTRPAQTRPDEDASQRLLRSAQVLSYDPATEVDWEAPLPDHLYGLNPEWSTLYGTPLWDAMTEQQRVTLTRHEVCSIMCTGIWFEMILQQMLLREQYVKDVSSATFQFALTEIADECRHSIMFARICERMGVPAYQPPRLSVELGRVFKAVASHERAYAGMLVAEEVLDVMQRDWMRGADVLPIVRTASRIHVVEESRHMKFARQEVRAAVAGSSRVERWLSGSLVAAAAWFILTSMVNEGVYAAAGLDAAQALEQARTNPHRAAMMRHSSAHLMDFLDEVGLLPAPARAVYARLHML